MKKVFLLAIAIMFFNSCQNDDAAADSSFAMKSASADYSSYPATVQQILRGQTTGFGKLTE